MFFLPFLSSKINESLKKNLAKNPYLARQTCYFVTPPLLPPPHPTFTNYLVKHYEPT